MTPCRAGESFDWAALLHLIRSEFAYMDGRIDPPSSMHGLTADSIAEQAQVCEIWVIGVPPVACMFLSPRAEVLYVGKLAVATTHRGRGMARQLIDTAETRARALGLPRLELQARVELMENHAAFTAMGFVKTAETAHPGFTRPTAFTFQRRVP